MSQLFSHVSNTVLSSFTDSVLAELNGSPVLQDKQTVWQPRVVGDTIEDLVFDIFTNRLAATIGTSIPEKFARRAMADLAFNDTNNGYVIVDVKTHNLDTKFNMPNLTSVERISKFYNDDENTFSLFLVAYTLETGVPQVMDIVFTPLEKLAWNCLTIGALGWGQIQIANSNFIEIDGGLTRKAWMLQLCDAMDIFYPKEVAKITKRVDYFKKVREYWESR